MGVTPVELNYRQEGRCKLELFIDIVGDENLVDDLYCTDGEEYARLCDMLNPTFECVKCVRNKFINTIGELMDNFKYLNKWTVLVLQTFSSAEKNSDHVYVEMSKPTLLDVKDFMSKTFIYTSETSPLREVEGKTYLFGKEVIFNNKIKAGIMVIMPGNFEVEV